MNGKKEEIKPEQDVVANYDANCCWQNSINMTTLKVYTTVSKQIGIMG